VNTTAELLLYDVIGADPFIGGGITAKVFREQVKGLKAKSMNLRVNSPGGDVFEAAAMMAALDEFKGRITVDVDGLAASAASYLIMAADEIRLGTNAAIMIHDPHAISIGGADTMERMAGKLRKTKQQIITAYKRKSRASREQLSDWMSAETWFTGKEAVDAGLADSVTEPVRVAALSQHTQALAKLGYKHVPEFAEVVRFPEDSELWRETRRCQKVAAQLMPDQKSAWRETRKRQAIARTLQSGPPRPRRPGLEAATMY
jgi:ATP-dependent protease ClpP protease subunit